MAVVPVCFEAGSGGPAVAGVELAAAVGQVSVAVADELAAVPALAAVEPDELAVVGVERAESQVGPDELGAGPVGCRAGFRADSVESPVG